MSNRTNLLRDIAVNAALPYGTYLLLTSRGIPAVPALVAGSVFPIVAGIVGFIRERRVQVLGVIVIVAAAASAIGALYFTSPLPTLAKGSLITGTVGLLFLASLLRPRPLVFHLASTGQDAGGRQRANEQWDTTPGYRSVMRRLTAIWAIALLVEATLRLVLIPLLPIAIFLPVSEAMWIGFFTLMTAWSWRYGRRAVARLA
jgi:hypothetical protein